MNRTALIATTLFAVSIAGAAIDDPVKIDTGMISGADGQPGRASLQGYSLRGAARGRSTLARTEASRALGRNPQVR